MIEIPKIPLITVRPVTWYECDGCEGLFMEPDSISEWEPTESPGFESGGERRFQVSPCCLETFHEHVIDDEESED